MITHMFPLNRRIPRCREAWLLTLVDKADSIDFILHPIALYHIFFHKEIKNHRENVLRRLKKRIQKKLKDVK